MKIKRPTRRFGGEHRFEKARYFFDELFHLPRIFFAWIIVHIASWLNMELIQISDEGIELEDVDEMFQDILADADIEDFDIDLDDPK